MPSITVVGSINVDITAQVARFPAPGETIGGGVISRQPGGKGGNQAAAVGRLGGSVRIVGAVGDDAEGRWAIQSLATAGVGTADVRIGTRPTGIALVTVDSTGENEIVVCPGANQDVSLAQVDFADDEVVLAQLEIPMGTLIELAARVPGFLAINTAPAQPLPSVLIERTDLFIANASEYAGTPELHDAKLVAVTHGAEGAVLLSRGREIAKAASPRVASVNTVGAGDAFCGALVLALINSMPYTAALQVACAVGADAVTHTQAQPPLKKLIEYMEPRSNRLFTAAERPLVT